MTKKIYSKYFILTKYFELSIPGIKLFIIKMPICISAVKFLSSDFQYQQIQILNHHDYQFLIAFLE